MKFMKNQRLIDKVLSRKPPTIQTKTECYALYEAGYFGNKPLTWNSYQEIVDSTWKGMVCMRSRTGTARKNVRYDIPLDQIPQEIKAWRNIGIPEESIAFNQSLPNEHLLIQGEVQYINGIFYMTYTKVKKPMNLALEEETLHAHDPKARVILKDCLSHHSYEDLEKLLEVFPNDIIEFSTFRVNVGNRLLRNTIFWEVRNY